MKTRLLFVPLVLALVVSVAACGSSSHSVPANAVAVVNGVPITLTEYNFWLGQEEAQKRAQGQPTDPTTLRPQVVALLVQFEEVRQQAKKLHVTVTNTDVAKFIADYVKKNLKGSMKDFLAQLKKQGLTMKGAQAEVYQGLLQQKIRAKVTSAATVTVADEKTYYTQNIAQYSLPASTTRNIQYILFKCAPPGSTTCTPAKSRAEKKLADKVEQKLKGGASFAAMAKQYSNDTTTASTGGHLCISQTGQSGSCIPTVPAFSKAGFALKTGTISPPVDATSAADQGYGWFIIKATEKVKTTKAHTSSFTEVQAKIKQALLQQQQATLFQKWISDLVASYKGKITYQNGYAPPPTTSVPTTT